MKSEKCGGCGGSGKVSGFNGTFPCPICTSYPPFDCTAIKNAIQKRVDGINKWIDTKKKTVFIFVDLTENQRHLDDGSVEQAYWHHGYKTALNDVLAMMDKRKEGKP